MSLKSWGDFIESFDYYGDAYRFVVKQTAKLRAKGLADGISLDIHPVKAAAAKKWYYSVYMKRETTNV